MTKKIDNDRWYEHPITRAQVPSVTTILDSLAKPALVTWAANTTATWAVDNIEAVVQLAATDREAAVDLLKGARWRTTRGAAGRGTNAHDVIENLATGRRVQVHPSMSWAKAAWEGLNKEFDIEVVAVERTIFNEVGGWAGSFDMLAWVNGELAIIDTKTSNGVYAEVALQACAYAQGKKMLLEDGTELDMPQVERTYCLWVRPAGFALIPLRYDQAVYDTFRALVRVHRWLSDESKIAVGKPINENGLTKYRDKKWLDAQEAAQSGDAA
jgi:hypothetical protein